MLLQVRKSLEGTSLNLPQLTIYSRRGCHLCELLIEELQPLIRGRAEFEVRDIDSRADWAGKYGTRIPVVELDGRFLCQYHLDADAIANALGEA